MERSRWERFKIAALDFIDEFYHSWVVRLFGATAVVLSALTSVVPNISSQTKVLCAILIFLLGLLVGLLIYVIFPRKYVLGFAPEGEELSQLRINNDNDAIAMSANRFARAHFGKGMGFSFRKYRKWRKKNPFIFAAFLTRKGDLVGFVDVFPLTRSAGEAMIRGDVYESELSIEDIVEPDGCRDSDHIYVASVVCCSRSSLADSVVLSAAIEYVRSMYPARLGRRYMAVGGTKDGLRVLDRFGFVKTAPEGANRARSVYCLDSDRLRVKSRALKDFGSLLRPRLVAA
jgi:hypothetical protein